LTPVYKEISEADVLIFGSPIYFGHITGPLKSLIDRFYPYVRADFSVEHLPGKKVITVATSGAPEKVFCEPISVFFKDWLGDFFKMDIICQINAGGNMSDEPVGDKISAMEEARKIGAEL